MITTFIRILLAALALAVGISAAAAAPGPVIDGLAKSPLTVLTFGLQNLRAALQSAFVGADAQPFSAAVAPMTGQIADSVTLIYSAEKGTITLNLIKIKQFDGDITPDEACRQAMAALRTFAGLDPITGKPYEGMDSSAIAYEFMPEGSPLDAAVTLPEIDKLFRLRYVGAASTNQRFMCTADLIGTTYEMEAK